MLNLRVVLESNKKSGYINSYSFTKKLTESIYTVKFNDGTIMRFRPVVGSNQNEIKTTALGTKLRYVFRLNDVPYLDLK